MILMRILQEKQIKQVYPYSEDEQHCLRDSKNDYHTKYMQKVKKD